VVVSISLGEEFKGGAIHLLALGNYFEDSKEGPSRE